MPSDKKDTDKKKKPRKEKKEDKKEKKPRKEKKEDKKGKKSVVKKENPWLTHVKKTLKEHPDKKFKEILIIAKKSYKK